MYTQSKAKDSNLIGYAVKSCIKAAAYVTWGGGGGGGGGGVAGFYSNQVFLCMSTLKPG